jgi:DNA polymerase
VATLHLDFETRSTVDLRKCGVYPYAAHPDTEVLLAAWAVDDGPVVWQTLGNRERLGTGDLDGLRHFLKHADVVAAHNAGFERLMIRDVLSRPEYGSLPPVELDRWDCTAARAARMALPRSLDGAARALGLDIEKDQGGYRLMLQMCKPRAARLAQGERPDAVYWFDDNDRMRRLGAYCATDVEVERRLDKLLKPLSPLEREIWWLTEQMNDRGVLVDMGWVNQALELALKEGDELHAAILKATSGEVTKTSQVARLKDWVKRHHGIELGLVAPEDDEDEDASDDRVTLDRRAIEDILRRDDLRPNLRDALTARLEAAKSSVSKYRSISARRNADNRVRGNLMYCGAGTGRYASTGVQMQNLRRDTLKDLDGFRRDADLLNRDQMRAVHGPMMDCLSRGLRAAIIAPIYHTLFWCDYSAVEARGVAWLAGASKLVNLFASGGKVYEAMAGVIYDRDPSTIGKDSDERWVAKQTVLGCGYGMGAPKFQAQCDRLGRPVSEELAQRAVAAYRQDNPEIPELWRNIEAAAIAAVDKPGTVTEYRGVSFKLFADGWLGMRLPSGRAIWYRLPIVRTVEKFGREQRELSYMAQNPLTKRWERESTWGGKLVENAVQGLCRDLMALAMLELDAAGIAPILTVHDEIICEVPDEMVAALGGQEATRDHIINLMTRVPDWAKGFPIAAEGKWGGRYGK